MSYRPFKKDDSTLIPTGDSALADGDLSVSEVTIWLDESNDQFELKAKKSGGSVISMAVGFGLGSLVPLTDYSTEVEVLKNQTLFVNQLTSHLLRDVWAASGALNTARHYLAGSGTQNAALSFGGSTGAGSAVTEKFNGTSWAASGALNTARHGLAGSGTQNAALSFGGATGAVSAVTEKFSNGFGTINHEIANRII